MRQDSDSEFSYLELLKIDGDFFFYLYTPTLSVIADKLLNSPKGLYQNF